MIEKVHKVVYRESYNLPTIDLETIVDIQDRIKSYTPEVKAIYQKAIEKTEEFNDLMNDRTKYNW